VAASSAVPLVLTPMTIRNYAGTPGAAQPRYLPRTPDGENPVSHREAEVLRALHSYADSESNDHRP
jgi:hypothetical protein